MKKKKKKYSIKFITLTDWDNAGLSPASLKVVIPQKNEFRVDEKVRVIIEEL